MAASNSTAHSLARLFPNPAVLDVLALVLLHPEQQFYQREIAERTDNAVLQVQRALKRILDAGLAEKVRRGNRVYYMACREHPAYQDLKRLLLKTIALGERLREALQPLQAKVLLSFVFGSVAAGTETSTSDIDLLIVGELSLRESAKVLGPLGRELGREFNPVVYPRKEFVAKARGANRFVRELVEGPKIWLIGSDDELARLVA